MHDTVVVRAIRRSVLFAMIIALALFGLVALERGAAPGPGSAPVFELSSHDNGNQKSNDKKSRESKPGRGPDNPPPACTKSNGKAPQKNPNCMSG